jgi:hypothetical protein
MPGSKNSNGAKSKYHFCQIDRANFNRAVAWSAAYSNSLLLRCKVAGRQSGVIWPRVGIRFSRGTWCYIAVVVWTI